jgi:Dynein light chain type 1
MTEEMADEVISIAKNAIKDHFTERVGGSAARWGWGGGWRVGGWGEGGGGRVQEMAGAIRKELVEKHSAQSWHAFVGRKFSSFVTHEEKYFIYFYVGQVGVVVFAS